MIIPPKQQGVALLIMITLLASAIATVTINALNNDNSQISRDQITTAALAQAKEALIGYAITYGDTHAAQVHGYLPCPDQAGGNPEGSAEPTCGSQDVSQLGRLPWRTLDLGALRGGDGECLWYAVSGNYKNNPKTGLMNWDTNGLLKVYAADGATLLTPPDNQAVAVIFSPGMASSGQSRSGSAAPICGGNYIASNYLDVTGIFNNAVVSGTANATTQFRMGDGRTGDHMVFITKQDIWNTLQKRNNFLATLDAMTLKTAECIASFGTKNKINGVADLTNMSLPWPAPLALSDYADNVSYDDSVNLFSGRVPYKVNNSRTSTGNTIANDFLLTNGICNAGVCINNCPNPADWANLYYPWWNNWKDHLFYGIAQTYQPDNNPTPPCGNCLSVNGTGKYAAVVIFANQKLSSQIRASNVTDPQRGIASNYLEGNNALNIAGPSAGIEDYKVNAAGSTFNDILYCIRQNLSVVKGNPALTPACP